jgi:hypothetical protein
MKHMYIRDNSNQISHICVSNTLVSYSNVALMGYYVGLNSAHIVPAAVAEPTS